MNMKFMGVAVLGAMMIAGAQAQVYRWSWMSAGHTDGAQSPTGNLFYNPSGGNINTLEVEFNASTQRLTFDVLYNNTSTNGFWLAMSPQDNPKGHAGELAIFYMDATTSSPVLTAYAYNGVNGNNSFSDGSPASGTQIPDFILSSQTGPSWVNSLLRQDTAGKRRLRFDIDATAINAHIPAYPGPGGVSEWTGAAFGEKIGMWFHSTAGSSFTYNPNGSIKTYGFQQAGWLDGDNLTTVPEPGTMAALGLGLAAIARRRHNKK